MSQDSHQKVLADLISGSSKPAEIDQRIQTLNLNRFDVEPLISLQLKDIQKILEKYISGEFSAEDIEDWANLIESYEDIEYEEKDAEQITQLIYELATPENEEELSPEIAQEILNSIS